MGSRITFGSVGGLCGTGRVTNMTTTSSNIPSPRRPFPNRGGNKDVKRRFKQLIITVKGRATYLLSLRHVSTAIRWHMAYCMCPHMCKHVPLWSLPAYQRDSMTQLQTSACWHSHVSMCQHDMSELRHYYVPYQYHTIMSYLQSAPELAPEPTPEALRRTCPGTCSGTSLLYYGWRRCRGTKREQVPNT